MVDIVISVNGSTAAPITLRDDDITSPRSERAVVSERTWDRFARAGRYGGQQLPSLLGRTPTDDDLDRFNAALAKLRGWERIADGCRSADDTPVSPR